MPRHSLWSADLSWRQRALLVGAVVVAHGLVFWVVLHWPTKPVDLREPPVIEAHLVTDAPRLTAPQPVARDEPPPSRHETQVPQVAREQAPQRRQAEAPPPVLASPRQAQANEPVAPVVESRVAPLAPAPAPVALSPTAVRAPKDLAGDVPAGAERGRNEAKDHTISPADYLVKPPNDYPSDAYDAGESGTVRFEVLIDEAGRPEDFKIARTSGSPRLDRQARRNVMRARFKPRTENGQPWKGWLHGQMTFTAPD